MAKASGVNRNISILGRNDGKRHTTANVLRRLFLERPCHLNEPGMFGTQGQRARTERQ